MKKTYLVDIIGDGLTQETARRPFFADYLSNWSAVDGGNKFLVEVDASEEKHKELEKNSKAKLLTDKDEIKTLFDGFLEKQKHGN